MLSPTTVNNLTLINPIIQFLMSGIAWILSLCLLRYHYFFHKILSFSPTMLFYFLLVFISSFQTFWHTLYLIVLWRPDGPIYDPVYVYIAQAISSQLQATVPLVEFFVCFDRIFTVLFPGKYTHRKRCFPVIVAISIAFGLQFGYNYAYDLIGGIPFEWNKNNGVTQIYQKSGAMIYSTIKKATISLSCFSATIYFYFILRKIHFSSNKSKKINKAILAMLIVSIFTDFLPNLSYAIGMIIFGKSLTDVLGPFSISFTSINIGVSSILYWNTFRKLFHQGDATRSIQISHTPVKNWFTND